MMKLDAKQKKYAKLGAIGAVAFIFIAVALMPYSDGTPLDCGFGFHMENGICVPDQPPISCPTGYEVINATCVPTLPVQSTTYSISSIQYRVTDRDSDSVKFNLIVKVPSNPTPLSIAIHMRVLGPDNVEVAHEVKSITSSNSLDYRNVSFFIDGLDSCTTYKFQTYALSASGTEAYSPVFANIQTTSGCPLSLASLFSFL